MMSTLFFGAHDHFGGQKPANPSTVVNRPEFINPGFTSSINGPFSMAMLKNQRVYICIYIMHMSHMSYKPQILGCTSNGRPWLGYSQCPEKSPPFELKDLKGNQLETRCVSMPCSSHYVLPKQLRHLSSMNYLTNRL